MNKKSQTNKIYLQLNLIMFYPEISYLYTSTFFGCPGLGVNLGPFAFINLLILASTYYESGSPRPRLPDGIFSYQ
jgi:hypothetical protein